MQFEHEIVLLYNQDEGENIVNNDIWRENFIQSLLFTLEKVTGVTHTIPMLNLSAENVRQELNTARLLIILIDDPFLESNISDQILRVCAENQADTKNMLPFSERLLPVIASGLPRELFPEVIRNHEGYDFSSVRLREKMVQEKKGTYGHSKSVRTLWLKVFDLAKDIKTKLARFEKLTERKAGPVNTIYLAQTTHDLVDIRDEIKRDLKRHGYRIIPDELITAGHSKVKTVINRYLSKARTSIHLIGENYGEIIYDNKSIVDLQNKLAEEHSARVNSAQNKEKFHRIIWVNPEAEILSERQKKFTENIKRDIESKQESELLQSPVEELKAFIRTSVNKRSQPEKPWVELRNSSAGNKNSIYLIFDRKDHDTSETVRKFLTDHGFDVLVPVFDGDFFELENLHKTHLISCDACMVIAKKANKNWLNTKLKDIDKIHGFGRLRPIKAKAVYLASGSGHDQMLLNEKNGTIIINHEGQITDQVMEPFLNKFIKEDE